jgi:hypothetical protein
MIPCLRFRRIARIKNNCFCERGSAKAQLSAHATWQLVQAGANPKSQPNGGLHIHGFSLLGLQENQKLVSEVETSKGVLFPLPTPF